MEHKEFVAEIKTASEQDLTIEHFISTETPDRMGDIVRADGMRIRGKPVVLMSHGRGPMGTEPIAKPVWIRAGTFKGTKGVMAKTEFFPDETGERLWAKAKGGFMPNFSIGFQTIESKPLRDSGTEILKWDLLEYSICGVPANPEATTLSFKMMPDQSPRVVREILVYAMREALKGEYIRQSRLKLGKVD